MAFGIDDGLAAAAAAISLTDTVVRTVKAYRKKGLEMDIEQLIEEVGLTALRWLDEADIALSQFERTLVEKGVDVNKSLQEIIMSTPIWRPFEQHRLKQFRRSFNALAEATYNAIDDIAALLRCRDQTGDMGIAVVESAEHKHKLHGHLLDARSINIAIELLRAELLHQKKALMNA